MKTILILTDFSVNADHAAHYALHLAQKLKANVLLCHMFVVPYTEPMTTQIAWPMENYGTLQEDSVNDLNELSTRLKRQLTNDVVHGDFLPEIEQFSKGGSIEETFDELSKSHQILMTVISMHGASSLSLFFSGNHASNIIEKANCPLLLIPYELPYRDFKKITFATDLTHSDIDVLKSVTGLGRYFDSEIFITHISDEKSSGTDERPLVKNFLDLVSSNISYPQITYKEIKSKNVTDSLDLISRHTDIDLLVLVHRKRNFFQRILEGSVTLKLAGHFTKPILVFPCTKAEESLPVF